MISKEDIEHLKDLARIEFGEEETKKLTKDLGDILSYIDVLKEADVSGAGEATYAIDLKNIFRKDGERGRDSSVIQAEIARGLIDAFPDKSEGEHGAYLKVKSILQ
ncbi:MAG: Asp-tRNA(Asn)/Glu-tRNA(Gln) amidotransferase subunit GatC [bacterium]|nr:Asp-tRNA(Asn)/Glu-tRNA(Gln) amidotransferase subunit GatC [bacterium]